MKFVAHMSCEKSPDALCLNICACKHNQIPCYLTLSFLLFRHLQELYSTRVLLFSSIASQIACFKGGIASRLAKHVREYDVSSEQAVFIFPVCLKYVYVTLLCGMQGTGLYNDIYYPHMINYQIYILHDVIWLNWHCFKGSLYSLVRVFNQCQSLKNCHVRKKEVLHSWISKYYI